MRFARRGEREDGSPGDQERLKMLRWGDSGDGRLSTDGLDRQELDQVRAQTLQHCFGSAFGLDHQERQGKLLWLCFRKSWRRFSLDHEERQGGQ